MQRHKPGEAVDCPNCRGAGKLDRKKCRVCDGDGRVEYQEPDGQVVPPVGSWMATGYRGRTNYLIVVWNHTPQHRTREA